MNIWDNKNLLESLEKERETKRLSGRITFDCMNLKFRGERAYCSKGRLLGQAKDGSLALIAVLRGILSGNCKSCEYYNEEESDERG